AGVPVAAKIALAIDAERPDCIVLHGRGHMLRKQAGRASGCDPIAAVSTNRRRSWLISSGAPMVAIAKSPLHWRQAISCIHLLATGNAGWLEILCIAVIVCGHDLVRFRCHGARPNESGLVTRRRARHRHEADAMEPKLWCRSQCAKEVFDCHAGTVVRV